MHYDEPQQSDGTCSLPRSIILAQEIGRWLEANDLAHACTLSRNVEEAAVHGAREVLNEIHAAIYLQSEGKEGWEDEPNRESRERALQHLNESSSGDDYGFYAALHAKWRFIVSGSVR